ncbi:DNA polymerase III subunit delta [Listeria grayi]|uniref:DNA polymerase III subunit delta n=1 Tax=Listeria grayi TaxID=1641 RepID=A0A378MAD2_LISGR|nr:DNA polymerase III subunit delta [Listeria grayi]STY43281.1 DNA polymerase III subunit delta [Listeria grayi]
MLAEWNRINKGKLAPLYLIIGTEDYIINETKKKLSDQILEAENSEFNYANFDLEETPVETVIEEAESMPFFGDRRLVIASNPVFLTAEKTKSKIEHRTENLERYLAEPAPYSVLCIIARTPKLDERKKLTKLIKKQATVIEAKPPAEKELKQWLMNEIAKAEMKIEPAALDRLIELTNINLTTSMNELQKLMLYGQEERLVTVDSVEQLVVRSLEQNIFLLLDKMIAFDIAGALRIYYDLLKQKEEPIKIMALIASQFRLLNQLKILEKQGYSQQQMATKLRVHPFRVKLASRQVRNFSQPDLDFILKQLAAIDYELKTGYGNKEQKFEWFYLHYMTNEKLDKKSR